ncbi:MAG: RluA family pseudouridine synthase [Hyphomicrobiales bacterium]
MREHNLIIPQANDGDRLDRVLGCHFGDISRSRFKALIKQGQVSADDRTIMNPDYRVKPGEGIIVTVPPALESGAKAQAIALNVIYEDDQLIVIDKPAGLVVHPSAGHWTGTLVNALLAHCGSSLSGIGGVMRPGIVHRLDKDTSGLMVAAKTDKAHAGLARQFAAHGRDGRLKRSYVALVWGCPERRKGVISAVIGRSSGNRRKMAVTKRGGRTAITHYLVKDYFPKAGLAPAVSYVECHLETGRTHQIRVHMSHMGHPLLGDKAYAAGFAASARRLPQAACEALKILGRQALHAARLGFEHPLSGDSLCFESTPPDDFQWLLQTLSSHSWVLP